jgi:hypothetical protein
MKNFKQPLFVFLFTVATLCTNAQTYVTGGIYSDVTWTLANSPYIVTGNTVVFPNVTLTIQPGVSVLFDTGLKLEVRGNINAVGTQQDSITFTASGAQLNGSYSGVKLNGVVLADFDYCKFMCSDIGLEVLYNSASVAFTCSHSRFWNNNAGAVNAGNSNVSANFDSCRFTNNGEAISFLHFDPVYIKNSLFYNNLTGVRSSMNGAVVLNCRFCNNSVAGVSVARKVENCLIVGNGVGIDFAADSIIGNIITGNGIGIDFDDPQNMKVIGNTICNNTNYNFYNHTAMNVSYPNNCWCTTDSAAIATAIYDGYDDVTVGLVDVSPVQNCDTSVLENLGDCSAFPPPVSIRETLAGLAPAVKIYPNPMKEWTVVVLREDLPVNAEVTVYTMLGTKVHSSSTATGKIYIRRDDLSPGMYLVEIRSGKVLAVEKLLVE